MIDQQTAEKVQELKRDFHAMMNGPVSSSLREKGLHYRIIYGVEWNRLVQLSHELGKNEQLAQALWKEDIRECRLLAGLVQPADTFLSEAADIWVESMHYPEEAHYTVLSLFQYLPYASEKAFFWIADSREIFQLCGWLLLSRLFMRGAPLNQRSEDEFADQAEAALSSTNLHIRNATQNAVLKYAQIGEREEHRLTKILKLCNF
ncbi:MAG: DNA alkylation repair protein [Bacteroidaceae bacterium]|jgi:hypothetical protein|nr:DNA alkylation repair protein [Bacteroidaceae bacterium]